MRSLQLLLCSFAFILAVPACAGSVDDSSGDTAAPVSRITLPWPGPIHLDPGQSGTATPLTMDATYSFGMALNGDLFAFKKNDTGTASTEVHVLSAASGYQQFILHTGTPIPELSANDGVELLVGPNRDLFMIQTQNTGSHMTEVHVLSAASNYQQWVVHAATPFAEQWDDSLGFAVGPNGDLFVMQRRNTATHSTEIHILSASSNYQQLSRETGTPLPECDHDTTFTVAADGDLVAIHRINTATQSVEVAVVSASSDYRDVSFAGMSGLHQDGGLAVFDGGASDKQHLLRAVKSGYTASGHVEVLFGTAMQPLPAITSAFADKDQLKAGDQVYIEWHTSAPVGCSVMGTIQAVGGDNKSFTSSEPGNGGIRFLVGSQTTGATLTFWCSLSTERITMVVPLHVMSAPPPAPPPGLHHATWPVFLNPDPSYSGNLGFVGYVPNVPGGTITSLTNGSTTLEPVSVYLVKHGFNTSQCMNTNDVVTLQAAQSTTMVAAVLGSTATAGEAILACATGTQPVRIDVTYTYP